MKDQFLNMALARLYCVSLLLLYSKISFGQQAGTSNQNIGANNAIGLHQQASQRISQSNQIPNAPNAGLNINTVQSNLQGNNLQQSPTLSATKLGNLQQTLNLQSQNLNNMQITKIGFSPVPPNISSTSTSRTQFQNTGIVPNGQIMQSQLQNIPNTNALASQIPNGPISTLTLGDLVGLKGQSLFSLIDGQNRQLQHNQQNVVPKGIAVQNQLSDMQKQFLMRSFQAQDCALHQHGVNMRLNLPRTASIDNQQTIAVHAVQAPQQGPALEKPVGPQQTYLTVQAQPLIEYLQHNAAATTTTDPIISFISSEFGTHATYPLMKKGSKINLKTLVPLIINLLKEKNSCGCQNCKCHNKDCQNNDCSNTAIESQIAQIFGGYFNSKTYGSGVGDRLSSNVKTTLDDNPYNNQKNIIRKNFVPVETEETEEDDSEYVDED